MSEKSGVAAVDRALTILDAFCESGGDALTLATLATKTGLYKSTILRLLVSLENFGYIRQLEDGRYKLGSKPSQLGVVYHNSFQLEELVNPVLRKLVELTEENTTFFIREGEHQVCLFRVNTTLSVREQIHPGSRFKINEGGAAPKAFRHYEKLTAADITANNFCFYSSGERDPDMAGVACPIFDQNDSLIGVMAVAGPLFRLTKKRQKDVGKLLTEEAIKLSISLGASPVHFSKLV